MVSNAPIRPTAKWARLLHIVCNRFQVYFTPLTGFFSPFPRGTCSLSVAKEYLALSRGRDGFMQSFTCTALLGIPLGGLEFLRTRLSRSMADFSTSLRSLSACHIEVPQPREDKSSRFRLFRFRSPLLTESRSFSFPGVTEMFHFTPYGLAGL